MFSVTVSVVKGKEWEKVSLHILLEAAYEDFEAAEGYTKRAGVQKDCRSTV